MNKIDLIQMPNYKGYYGSIRYSKQDKCYHGKIMFIDDIITYESDSLNCIESAFKSAVNSYISVKDINYLE